MKMCMIERSEDFLLFSEFFHPTRGLVARRSTPFWNNFLTSHRIHVAHVVQTQCDDQHEYHLPFMVWDDFQLPVVVSFKNSKPPKSLWAACKVSFANSTFQDLYSYLNVRGSHQKKCLLLSSTLQQLTTLWRNTVPTDRQFSTNPSLQNPSPNVHRPENSG